MGVPLAEYRTLRLIRESTHSRVYEAISERDGCNVIAKVFDIAGEADEYRVQHEFDLIQSLDIPGVVKARELRRVGDQLVLVLERAPGSPLTELHRQSGEPMDLPAFFEVAAAIAEILGQTHAQRVIHRDIKPSNILLHTDPVTNARTVVLADFGISVLLENERRHIYDAEVIVGTLPYISPEQTGRTGRAVDLRTDLYSLGVTFYELLTGRLPFENLPPLELIHAHLARTPDPPKALRGAVPEGLSRLIMRLLAKAPEARYQTAEGLRADLLSLGRLHAAGEDSQGFELGEHDHPPRLRARQGLYGRGPERARLSSSIARATRRGRRELLLISGSAGTGKTQLIHALQAELTGHGGYFARGSFKANSERPYGGFVEALSGLFDQFLTESDARLDRWRRRLQAGLGTLAPVIAEIAPRIELILGAQPPPPAVDALEASNRLLVALERVFAVVIQADYSLGLALEDVHWAGRPSVGVLEGLAHSELGPLVLALTLRPQQLEPGAPLELLCAELRGRGKLEELALEGLSQAGIHELLIASLGKVRAPQDLAQIVARKTGGVPLFAIELLERLILDERLRIDDGEWSWTREAVEGVPLPDDAAALMRAKLSELSESQRATLSRAAVLGESFELPMLSPLCAGSPEAVSAALFESETSGLLVRLGRSYAFAHESIRAAAVELLPAATRQDLRWRVGQTLLAQGDAVELRLFELVDHLDAGMPQDADDAHRRELAELDLRAGQRALASGAFELAARYLGHGVALLTQRRGEIAAQGSGHPDYEEAFRLHFNYAYTLALDGQREAATTAFTELIAWRLAPHHYAEVAARRVRLLWMAARHDEAVGIGLDALRALGVQLSPTPSLLRMGLALSVARRRVLAVAPQDWRRLEPCTDPLNTALMDLIARLKYPAFVTNNRLFLYLIAVHIRLMLHNGYHRSAAVALGDLSVGISGRLDRVFEATQLQDLARDLARREPTGGVEAELLAISGSLSLHRTRAFATLVEQFSAAYPLALEVGEFNSAGFLAGFGLDFQIETGTHLRVLERQCLRATQEVGRRCANQMRVELWILRGMCQALRGHDLDDEAPAEAELESAWNLDPERVVEHGGAPTNTCVARIARAQIELILGNPRGALAFVEGQIDSVEKVVFNTWYIARAALIFTVAQARCELEGLATTRASNRRVRRCTHLLDRWAWGSTTNYGHYRDLALGMRQAAAGRTRQALALLDHAFREARARGCRWVEGVAAEQLAFVLGHAGLPSLVHGAMLEAFAAYSAWGAETKLRQLLELSPRLGALPAGLGPAPDDGAAPQQGSARMRSSVSGSARLEITSGASRLANMLESVGAISENLELGEVIARTLDAALTIAGGGSGMLVLEREGGLSLVAQAENLGQVVVLDAPPLLRDVPGRAPGTVLHFALRTGQSVVLDDPQTDPRFAGDPYLEQPELRSAVAVPLMKNDRPLGALLIENRLATRAFSASTVEALQLVAGQAASVVESALLYNALHSSEARWRSLVDGAPDYIALLDERGRVVFRNHPGPLSGLAPGEHDDEDDSETPDPGELVPEDAQRWRHAIVTALEQGERAELELEYRDRQRDLRWLNVRLAPLSVHRGLGDRSADSQELRNVVVVASDITARRRAELDRESLEAQLRQQQRLESLGTLASGVAHEINNPIQGIMNYAELIRTNLDERAIVDEFAGEIDYEANRVATIVRNLLAFSRQDAASAAESTSLAAVVEATLSLIRTVLRGDHIDIEVQIHTGVPEVRCRAQQIQQVIMNLVTNARDALNERFGRSEEYDERKRIEIRVEPSARPGWVSVIVEDWGPGIPPHVLPRIFDPFYTTKGRDQGTGLGLAVSHGIVKDHGGELSVETVQERGTCFTLDLPSIELEASPLPPLPPRLPAPERPSEPSQDESDWASDSQP